MAGVQVTVSVPYTNNFSLSIDRSATGYGWTVLDTVDPTNPPARVAAHVASTEASIATLLASAGVYELPVLHGCRYPQADAPADAVEGWGARWAAAGWQDITTYTVTNLNDSGEGSLRAAIEAEGARIIEFDVAGYIDVETQLEIRNPYCFIRGETAPEPGITLRAKPGVTYIGAQGGLLKIGDMSFGIPELFVDVHDIIIRHIRMRFGGGDRDHSAGLLINSGHDIVIDHCSFSWSNDNLLTLWQTIGDPAVYNITIQRCIFSEAFSSHPCAMALHGYYDYSDPDSIIRDYLRIYNISIHHNLIVTCMHRLPATRTAGTEVINNLIYNWGYRAFMPKGDDRSDWINNYLRAGPVAPANERARYLMPWAHQLQRSGCPYPASIYSAGNIIEAFVGADEDDWNYWGEYDTSSLDIPLDLVHRRFTRMAQPPVPVTVQPASAIVDDILADCGATLPARDVVDARIVNEVATNTGPSAKPDDMADVGGWPEL